MTNLLAIKSYLYVKYLLYHITIPLNNIYYFIIDVLSAHNKSCNSIPTHTFDSFTTTTLINYNNIFNLID